MAGWHPKLVVDVSLGDSEMSDGQASVLVKVQECRTTE